MTGRLLRAIGVIAALLSFPPIAWPQNRRTRRALGERSPLVVGYRRDGRPIFAVSGGAAISFSNLDSTAGDSISSATSASVSPTANRILTFHVGAINATAIADPTISTTLSVTFELVASTASGGTRREWLYRALAGSSPGTGTITATFGSSQSKVMTVTTEIANAVLTGSNGARAIAQVDAYGQASLATSRAQAVQGAVDTTNNALFSCWLVGNPNGETINARSGWTKLVQGPSSASQAGNLMQQYIVGGGLDTTTSASWGASSNSHSNIIIVELLSADSTVQPGRVTRTLLDSGTASNPTTITTASVTVPATHLAVLFVSNNKNPVGTVTASGLSLTWTARGNTRYNTLSTLLSRITVLTAYNDTGSDQTGAVTITFSAQQNRGCYSLSELGNVDPGAGTTFGPSVIQVGSNHADAQANLTVTLSAFADSRNAVVAGFATDTLQSGFTNGAGFVDMHIVQGNTGASLYTEFCYSNQTSVSASWTGSNDCAGLALEVASIRGAIPAPPPTLNRLLRRRAA